MKPKKILALSIILALIASLVGIQPSQAEASVSLNWTTSTIGIHGTYAVAYNNSRWVAVGHSHEEARGIISTSTDGVNWTTQRFQNDYYKAIHNSNGRWVAVGSTDGGGLIATSTNGVNWTRQTVSPNGFEAVHFYNGRWVAVGGFGRIATSTDGVSWTSTTRDNRFFFGVHGADNRWVAVGGFGQVATSTNGTSWTAQVVGPATWDNSYRSVHYANGRWVIVGDKSILTSTNGTSWSSQTIPGVNGFEKVLFANNRWVAVGGNGFVTSHDGVNWTAVTAFNDFTMEFNSYRDVVHDGGQWVVVGNSSHWDSDGLLNIHEGFVLTSSDGVTWSKRQMSNLRFRCIAGVADRWVALTPYNGFATTTSAPVGSLLDQSQTVVALKETTVAVNGFFVTSLSEFTFPETIEGLLVDEFGQHAFSGVTAERLVVPTTVSTIDDKAFFDASISNLVILNSTADIFMSAETIPDDTVIYGYTPSTAQTYAMTFQRTFVSLNEPLGGGEEPPPGGEPTPPPGGGETPPPGGGEPTPPPITPSFTYYIDSNQAIITGYIGSVPVDLHIPSELGGFPVRTISSNAFNGRGVVNVTIPFSVQVVDYMAFANNPLNRITFLRHMMTISWDNDSIPFSATIVGYDNSTAQNYALCFGRHFESLGQAPLMFNYVVLPNPDNIRITGILQPMPAPSVIVIPATIDGKNVTALGPWSLMNPMGYTSVTIPSSVLSIAPTTFGDFGMGHAKPALIIGYGDTRAQTFAAEHQVPFQVILEAQPPATPPSGPSHSQEVSEDGQIDIIGNIESTTIRVSIPLLVLFTIDTNNAENPFVCLPFSIINATLAPVEIRFVGFTSDVATSAKVADVNSRSASEWRRLSKVRTNSEIALGIRPSSLPDTLWSPAEVAFNPLTPAGSFTINRVATETVALDARFGFAWVESQVLRYQLHIRVALAEGS